MTPQLAAYVHSLTGTPSDWRSSLVAYLDGKVAVFNTALPTLRMSKSLHLMDVQAGLMDALRLRAEAQTIGVYDAMLRLRTVDQAFEVLL